MIFDNPLFASGLMMKRAVQTELDSTFCHVTLYKLHQRCDRIEIFTTQWIGAYKKRSELAYMPTLRPRSLSWNPSGLLREDVLCKCKIGTLVHLISEVHFALASSSVVSLKDSIASSVKTVDLAFLYWSWIRRSRFITRKRYLFRLQYCTVR